jgi:hypothetical protein
MLFHTYYLQLKRAIESFPRIMLNTLHRFRPFAKFHVDSNFIYITERRDESKEELQSYYNLTEEKLEEITKDLPKQFLVLVDQAELSDSDLVGIHVVTREEYDAPNSSKKKKKEDVHEINRASEETASNSPSGGGDDEVHQEEGGEKEKHELGEVTPPRDPLPETEASKKRKVYP